MKIIFITIGIIAFLALAIRFLNRLGHAPRTVHSR